MSRQSYAARFEKVLTYIDSHPEGPLDIEILCRIANFSKFHFHRQFTAWFGITVGRYVQLSRLRRAGYRLAFREDPMTDIAMEAGFERPESFSRAFRNALGQNPLAFRRSPAWKPWQEIVSSLPYKESAFMQNRYQLSDVNIIDFAETQGALLSHRGPVEGLGETLQHFIAWRKRFGPSPATGRTFNIVHHDPDAVPPEAFRFDVCASVGNEVEENEYGVVTDVIPAGRCAVLRHQGPERELGSSIRFLLASWLPDSGETLRDFPLFLHRVTLFPDVNENEMIVDIHLPII